MWTELGKAVAVVVVKKVAEELIKQSRKQAVWAGWGWLLFVEKIGEYMMMVVSQPKGVLAKALADEWAMLNGHFEHEGV